jgi:hypothetical protein
MNPQPGVDRPLADYGAGINPVARGQVGFAQGQSTAPQRLADVEWGSPLERADAMLAALERLTAADWRRVLRRMHDAWLDEAFASEWDRARLALPAALAALDDHATFATLQRRVGELVARLPVASQATRAHALLLALYAVGAEFVGPVLAPQHRSTLTRFFPLPGS